MLRISRWGRNGPTSKRTGGWTVGRRRRGAAVVEMAVVTPFLLLLIFGIVEFGYVFFARETLNTAVREACRVGILHGSTQSDIENRFMEAISAAGVSATPDMLTITESTPDGADYTVLTVTVSVPYENVSLVGPFLGLKATTLTTGTSMRKEGT